MNCLNDPRASLLSLLHQGGKSQRGIAWRYITVDPRAEFRRRLDALSLDNTFGNRYGIQASTEAGKLN